MIVMERRVIRSFRALLRKCVVGRLRGPAPSVSLVIRNGTLTLSAKTENAMLVYTAESRCQDTTSVVPMAVFNAVEGDKNDLVEWAVESKPNSESISWLAFQQVEPTAGR